MAEKDNGALNLVFDNAVLDDDQSFSEVVDLEGVVNGIPGINGAYDRDDLYTTLLMKYVNRFNTDQDRYSNMKKSFFWFVLVSMGVIVLGAIIFGIVALACPNISLAMGIVSVISAFISLMSSIIVLPKIIARHLFPEEKDNETLNLIKALIEDDCKIREAQETRIAKQMELQQKK